MPAVTPWFTGPAIPTWKEVDLVCNDPWPLLKGFKGHPFNNLPQTPGWRPGTYQVELVEPAILPSENADCPAPAPPRPSPFLLSHS